MNYKKTYISPLGIIYMRSDGEYLTGLWFEKSRDDLKHQGDFEEKDLSIFNETSKWLDIYFSGKEPNFKLPLHFTGTDFQNEVWEILYSIPYGKTMTYGQIANILAKRRGIEKMSAQAVGGAVGHNEISIIVPCHRVVGSQGSLTGYAGGIDRKVALLKLENVKMDKLYIPKKGIAL